MSAVYFLLWYASLIVFLLVGYVSLWVFFNLSVCLHSVCLSISPSVHLSFCFCLSVSFSTVAFPYIQAVREAARKTLEKKLSSRSVLLIPTVSPSAFHSTKLFLFSRHHISTNSVAPLSAYKPTYNPQLLQTF